MNARTRRDRDRHFQLANGYLEGTTFSTLMHCQDTTGSDAISPSVQEPLGLWCLRRMR